MKEINILRALRNIIKRTIICIWEYQKKRQRGRDSLKK